ncbi:uncharacterized protein LOC134474360 [Cavia porcellus]|uniref:uncharacterized protein LOC134474360 n=1 Tax=Cavia porcellus TaxID=10141 RepID=UPI002FE23D43
MLCCFPRTRGPSRRTPHRGTTWDRLKKWFTRPRSFRMIAGTHPTNKRSKGQGSLSPALRCPEARRSPGQVSLSSATSDSTTRRPGQIGSQPAESLADGCTASRVQADGPHSLKEPLEPAVLDSCPRPSTSSLNSSKGNISTPQAPMLERSTSSVLDSALEVCSHVDPQDELLLHQRESPEANDHESNDSLDTCTQAPGAVTLVPADKEGENTAAAWQLAGQEDSIDDSGHDHLT